MKYAGKILLADDEAHIRKYLSLIIRQLGKPTLIEAVNGQDALSVFEREKPKVVLLDVNMPLLGGIEILTASSSCSPRSQTARPLNRRSKTERLDTFEKTLRRKKSRVF